MWVVSYQYVLKKCHFDIVEPLIVLLSLSIKTSDSNICLAQTCIFLKYEYDEIVLLDYGFMNTYSCKNGNALFYCHSTICHYDNEQNITNNDESVNS